MPNIFPDASKGGIIVSNGGVATGASGVTNAWLPVAGFTVTCPVTAYPDANCAFQITGATLNAINAEIGMMAQAMNPTGVWNCNTTGNLAANFAAWAATIGPEIVEPLLCDSAVNTTPAAADKVIMCKAGVVSHMPMSAFTAAVSPTGTVATAPTTTNLPAIPTIHFGTNTGYLGAPVRWVAFNLPGVTGLITVPSYT